MKRAAHFLLHSDLAYSPPNDAIVTALLGLGYAVDLYAPGGDFAVEAYGTEVNALPVAYGLRWMIGDLFATRWRQYDLFSGTSEDPMAIVGVLSTLYRKPSFCLADEIRSGGYSGSAPEYWKKLCRWGIRHSVFNIVNDATRITLQRDYSGLNDDAEVMVYPGCYREPPAPIDPKVERRRWGIPGDAFVIGHSGWLNYMTGADWVLECLKLHEDVYAVMQPMQIDPMSTYLINNCTVADRLFIEARRLGWRESWASMSAVDVGIIVYRNQGPQFQKMGISSNKLCMFLAMGVPVIALKQESFHFIEDYECGVLIDDMDQLDDALTRVKENLMSMKQNALRCTAEYINAPGRYEQLKTLLADL